VWVISTSCSPTASASLSARTVTICAVPQSPLEPCVKVSVSWSPSVPESVSTATAVVSCEATTMVTVAPGSDFSTTVYVFSASEA